MEKISTSQIKKGSIQVVFSNVLSIITNIIKALVIPMIISSLKMYSFWQIYLFYLSYVLIVSIGFNDGIYVKYTGVDIPKEDKNKAIRSSLLIQMIFSTLIFFVSLVIVCCMPLGEKKIIYVFLLCNIVPMEFIDINLKLLQSSFEMKKYSIYNIIDKILFLILIIIIIPFGKVNYFPLIAIDLIVKIIVCLLLCKSLKKYWSIGKINYKQGIEEWKSNIKIGKYIIVSTYLLILITGIGRIAIEWIGTVEEYAFYSLAMSFSNIINLIISSIGLVLFPLYKSVSKEKSIEYSDNISKLLLFLTPMVLLSYFPFKIIITIFLKNYIGTIYFLGFIIPITILKSFSSLIFIPLMKSERKEKNLFFNNGIAIVIYLLVFIPIYVYTKKILIILIGTIIITFLELLLNCICLKMKKKNLLLTFIIIITFIVLLNVVNIHISVIIMMLFLIYIYISDKEVYNTLLKRLLNMFFPKNERKTKEEDLK